MLALPRGLIDKAFLKSSAREHLIFVLGKILDLRLLACGRTPAQDMKLKNTRKRIENERKTLTIHEKNRVTPETANKYQEG